MAKMLNFMKTLSVLQSNFAVRRAPNRAMPVLNDTQKSASLLFSNGTIMRNFSLLSSTTLKMGESVLSNQVKVVTAQPSRTITKFSRRTAKRQSVPAVLKRFHRLTWGAWIRTIPGREKKHWRKTEYHQHILKKHLLCRGKQSRLLDNMTTAYWRKPKFYVDDPYHYYHKRPSWHKGVGTYLVDFYGHDFECNLGEDSETKPST